MSKQDPLSLGDAIDAFLRQHGLRDEAKVQEIIAQWETLVGKPIAQNTRRVWFKAGTLYVAMESPMWKQELQMARLTLCNMLNEKIGEEIIREVKVV